jgi:hypothetical protein
VNAEKAGHLVSQYRDPEESEQGEQDHAGDEVGSRDSTGSHETDG